MKRDRPSTPGLDPPEVLNFDSRRKIADRGEKSEFCEEDFEWPASPLEKRFQSPATPSLRVFGSAIQKRSSSPAMIKTAKSGILMRDEDSSHQMEVCRTPEDALSPKLHSPPPRPHKLWSPNSSTPKLAHPQPKTKNVALGELMGKIELKTCVLRRIASSTNTKAPKRPRPELTRNQTVADIPRMIERSKTSTLLQLLEHQALQASSEEGLGMNSAETPLNHPLLELPTDDSGPFKQPHSEIPLDMETSTVGSRKRTLEEKSEGQVDKAVERRRKQDQPAVGITPPISQILVSKDVPSSSAHSILSENPESKAKAGSRRQNSEASSSIQVDPSVGAGLFHHATVSRLRSHPGSATLDPGQDDWVDGAVRYNPYDMFKSRPKTSSSTKPSPAPSSSRDSSANLKVSLPSTVATTSPESPALRSGHLLQQGQAKSLRSRTVNTSLDSSYNLPFEVDSDEDSLGEDIVTAHAPDMGKGLMDVAGDAENRPNMIESSTSLGGNRLDHEALFMFEMETEMMEKQLESFKVLAEAQEGEAQILATTSSRLVTSIHTKGWRSCRS